MTNDTAAVARGQVVVASASMVFFAAPPAYTGITEFAGKSGLYTASSFPSSNLVLSARGTSSGIDFYAGGAASSNKSMVIASSGNVAIGSSTPDSKLCITGQNVTLTFENTTNAPAKSYFGTYNLGSLSLIQLASNRRTSDAFIFDVNRAPAYFNITSAFNDSYITFHTSTLNNTEPAERMRVDSSGNLGIKTALPTVKLDVRGSGLFYNDTAVTGSTSLRIQEGAGQANSEVFGVYSNDLATTRMNIRNGVVCVGSVSPTALLNVSSSSGLSAFFSGSVGVGTSSTDSNLHIFGGANQRAHIQSASGYAELKLTSASAAQLNYITAINGPLDISVGGSNRIYVKTDGTVGIGVTTPSQKLDVVGNIKGTNLIVGSVTFNASAGGAAISLALPTVQGSNSSVLTNNGSGGLSFANFGGAPQSYTPTFAGLGTCSSVYFTYQRMFGNMIIRGTFTTGSVTADEITISLPGAFAVASALTPTYTIVGQAVSVGVTAYLPVIVKSSDTALRMGANNGPSGLSPRLGNSNYINFANASVYAIIPVDGWT
jgi:hypothetical protein